MSNFTDENGNPIEVVNEDNLAKFQVWLLENQQPQNLPGQRVKVVSELSLETILSDENGKALKLNEHQQRYVARVVLATHYDNKSLDLMINSAEKYPYLLGQANQIAGAGWAGSYGNFYDQLHDKIAARNIVDNIPVIRAIVISGGMLHKYGTGKITTLSSANQKHLNEIFQLSKFAPYRTYSKVEDAASVCMEELATSKLVNYQQASAEFRKFINQQIAISYEDVRGLLNELNPEFYDKELLSGILSRNLVRAKSGVVFDTTKAKSQAEKNKNILPPYYTKTITALAKLAEDKMLYDADNYGRLAPLTERYKAVCIELCAVKDWRMVPQMVKESVVKDGYLLMAQKEVIAGNGEQLSKEDLELVLKSDRKDYYLKKINPEILAQKQVKLNVDQQQTVALKDKEKLLAKTNGVVSSLITSKKLSSSEKEELLKLAERQIKQNQGEKQYCQEYVEQYEQDTKALTELNHKSTKAKFVSDGIAKIQQAYANIVANWATNGKEAAERHLQPQEVEKVVSLALSGEQVAVELPEHGSLPLLIGRKAEKQRRENLAQSINNFNEMVKTMVTLGVSAFKGEEVWPKQYRDKMLAQETAQQADAETKNAWAQYQSMMKHQQINYQDIDRIRGRLAGYELQEESLKKAKEWLSESKAMLKNTARDNLGLDSEQVLAVADASLEPKDKAKVRAANKKISDKLAEKVQDFTGKSLDEKLLARGAKQYQNRKGR